MRKRTICTFTSLMGTQAPPTKRGNIEPKLVEVRVS